MKYWLKLFLDTHPSTPLQGHGAREQDPRRERSWWASGLDWLDGGHGEAVRMCYRRRWRWRRMTQSGATGQHWRTVRPCYRHARAPPSMDRHGGAIVAGALPGPCRSCWCLWKGTKSDTLNVSEGPLDKNKRAGLSCHRALGWRCYSRPLRVGERGWCQVQLELLQARAEQSRVVQAPAAAAVPRQYVAAKRSGPALFMKPLLGRLRVLPSIHRLLSIH